MKERLLKLFCRLLYSIMEWWEVAHQSVQLVQRGKLQQLLLHSGESMTPSRLGMTLPGPSSSPQKRNTESSARRRPTIRPCANIRLLFFFKMRHLFIFPFLTPPAGVFLWLFQLSMQNNENSPTCEVRWIQCILTKCILISSKKNKSKTWRRTYR